APAARVGAEAPHLSDPVPVSSVESEQGTRSRAAGEVRSEPPSVPPADAPDAQARRQQILRMDWAPLKAEVARCVACPLHRNRTQTVFGVGDENADWMFVGEGPGAE